MTSQSINEAPSEIIVLLVRIQYDVSLDPDMGPREALERHRGQAGSQDLRPQNNQQPQDPNQGTTNVGGRKQSSLWAVLPKKALKDSGRPHSHACALE